jgi:hypothetical protein
VELAVATAAALSAYALAYLQAAPAGLRWATVAGACALAAAAWAVPIATVPPRVARGAGLVLRLLLIVAGSLVVFARQFPVLRHADARRLGASVGGALALLALGFLASRRALRVHSHLVLALAGVLVAAGLERNAPGYVWLAGAAGLAAWVDAFRSGGPRRPGLPVVAAGAASLALAAGIVWFLPVAQPVVQEMLGRAYGWGQTGLSDRSELGEVASLARSRRVVARVWTDRPQLLRMQVFAQFDGRRWAAFPPAGRRLEPVARGRLGPLLASVPGLTYASGQPPVGLRGLAETRVMPELWLDDGWGLLAPSGPLFLVWPDEGVAMDDRGLITTGGSWAQLYGVANRAAAGVAVPPTDLELALPVQVDPRVRALAASLQAGEAPGPAVVGRTVDHLRTRYRYTLDVGRFASRDPLAEFLFDKRAGYCEYFATAAVVLLRLQGVPARYVKGVAVRRDALMGAHYVVREWDAHAWAEVWTPETGWTEVDPTPPDGWAATHPAVPPGLLATLWERAAAGLAQAWARWWQESWPRITSGVSELGGFLSAHHRVVFGALSAVLVVLALVRLRPRPDSPVERERARMAPELEAALARIEEDWAHAGRPRPPSRGLREHLDLMPAQALSAELRGASERVVQAVYRAVFAGRPPLPAEARALDEEVRSLPRSRRRSR